jgi:hypothetical protein
MKLQAREPRFYFEEDQPLQLARKRHTAQLREDSMIVPNREELLSLPAGAHLDQLVAEHVFGDDRPFFAYSSTAEGFLHLWDFMVEAGFPFIQHGPVGELTCYYLRSDERPQPPAIPWPDRTRERFRALCQAALIAIQFDE